MNAKQEFVKSIMSVLRLEQNIYTNGAIETIIDRLKVNDYQMFIAYLGERDSNYEKPIESIAKGVDEFYNMKLKPHKENALKKQELIKDAMLTIKEGIKKETIAKYDNSHIIEEVNIAYEKQPQETKDYQIKVRTMSATRELAKENTKKFAQKTKRDSDVFKRIVHKETSEIVFNEDILDIVFSIGLEEILCDDNFYYSNKIFDHIFTKKLKPSIANQIEIKEIKKINNEDEIADKTLALLKRSSDESWR